MAIIYTYTKKSSVAAADTFIISDSADDNKTKTVTAQEIANYVDGEVTLQEVLDTGSTAVSTLGAWAGVMSLGISGSPGINVTLDVNGTSGPSNTAAIYTTGNGEYGGKLTVADSLGVGTNAVIDGDLSLSQATSNIIMNGGDIKTTSGTDLNFIVTTNAGNYNILPSVTGVDFIAGTVLTPLSSSTWEVEGAYEISCNDGSNGNFIVHAAADMELRADTITLQTNGGTGHILDLGNWGSSTNRFDTTLISAEDLIRLKTYNGTAFLELDGATGSINTQSAFDITAGNELRLAGSAGVDGQIMISKGVSNNPEWINTSTLSVENLIEEVENNTGSLIPKGTPIYIAANPAGTPRVEEANSSDPLKMPASGLAVDDIPAGVGQTGQMIISGQLSNVSVVGFGIGDTAYVGPGGGLVAVKPPGQTEGIQNVGIVTKTGGNGSIQVTAIGRINDLPNNHPNALFTADTLGHPVSTSGVIDVDVANQLTTITNKYEIKGLSPYGTNNNIIGNESGTLIGSTGTANANVYIGKRAAGAAGAANPNSDNSSFNVAIGNQTLAGNNLTATTPLKNTSSRNIAIGHQALSQPGGPTAPTTASLGEGNIAIGYQTAVSLYNAGGGEGASNVVIGNTAGFNLSLANHSTLIGANAGGALADGTGNTCVGFNATIRNAGDERAVAVGYNTEAESLGIALGAEATAGVSQLNINVSGVPNTPLGGLPATTAAGGPYPPAGLGNGDVYVIEQVDMGNLGGVPGQLVNILAIV